MVRFDKTMIILWSVLALASFGSFAHALSLSTPRSTKTSNTPRVALPGLDASRFRHPLDRDLTARLLQLPGNSVIQQALRRALSLAQQGVRLDLLSTAVQVSADQRPDLYQNLQQACAVLDLQTIPELYIQNNPQANAYTLAFQNNQQAPIVAVTSALLDQCTAPEIQAILGHELGHLKCEHSIYLSAGGLMSTPLRQLPVIGPRLDQQLAAWRQSAEYTCDRAALLVAQDVTVVTSALLKLVAGGTRDLNVEAFLEQCRAYEAQLQAANPLIRAALQQQGDARTHPLPVRRVAALEKWAASDEYARILLKGEPLESEEENEMEEKLDA